MTAFLRLKDTLEPRMNMPYQPWFETVSPLLFCYPPNAMAEVYFELECADMGKGDVDNLFVSDYNGSQNFKLEIPDD